MWPQMARCDFTLDVKRNFLISLPTILSAISHDPFYGGKRNNFRMALATPGSTGGHKIITLVFYLT